MGNSRADLITKKSPLRAIVSLPLWLLLSVWIMPFAAQAATYQTYVIHTYGGDALLPAVRQQLSNSRDGGSASTYQDKLVLQTTTANYAAVQQLLKKIDGQPQALSVAVRVGNNSNVQSNTQQGRIIISNQGIQGTGVISQSTNQQQNNSHYHVQTLSGSAASISTSTLYSLMQTYQANSYPTYSRSLGSRPAGQIIIQQQVLLPTVQGIAVTPRLLPNGQVEVQLNQVEEALVTPNSSYNQNRYNQNRYNQNSAIQAQRLTSTIIVPRGQWITIGQISQNSQNQSASYGGSSASNRSNSVPIELLVQ